MLYFHLVSDSSLMDSRFRSYFLSYKDIKSFLICLFIVIIQALLKYRSKEVQKFGTYCRETLI